MSIETRLEGLEKLVGDIRAEVSAIAVSVAMIPTHFEQAIRSVENNVLQRITSTAELLTRHEVALGALDQRVDILESDRDQRAGGRKATDRAYAPLKKLLWLAAASGIGALATLILQATTK